MSFLGSLAGGLLSAGRGLMGGLLKGGIGKVAGRLASFVLPAVAPSLANFAGSMLMSAGDKARANISNSLSNTLSNAPNAQEGLRNAANQGINALQNYGLNKIGSMGETLARKYTPAASQFRASMAQVGRPHTDVGYDYSHIGVPAGAGVGDAYKMGMKQTRDNFLGTAGNDTGIGRRSIATDGLLLPSNVGGWGRAQTDMIGSNMLAQNP